jgi:hypothetical protein
MGVTSVFRRRATGERVRTSSQRRALTPAEAAWIAAIPCTLLTLAAALALGPLVGDLFLAPRRGVFWPSVTVTPQPTQHGRFLVGLLGAPLLAAVVLVQGSARDDRRAVLPERTIRALVLATQVALAAFLIVCVAAQNNVVVSADFLLWGHYVYFRPATLVVALLLPAAALAGLRGRRVGATVLRATRETRGRRIACLVAAALYTALWLTTAIDLESSIGNTIRAVSGHLLWTMAEAFAVLDGRTPLVDYHAQYGQLWAYLAALVLRLFGTTIATYTFTMAAASGLAMLGVYAIFRRLTRSSLAALALYVPFLATAFFTIVGPLSDRYGPQNLFLLWPIRYAGPMLLAWLAARHLDGAAPRRAWPIFAVAALVTINNPDFGFAATLATFTALAIAGARTRRALGRLALEAAGAAAAVVALFALFTLVRSGSLPHFHLLFEFSRLYGVDGWGHLPIPELGLHSAVFLTFVAALAVAAVRVARASEGTLLTGMLAWVGVFGLLASVYFVGRAHPLALFDFFAPWAFAIVLLLLVVVPGLDARGWRRPALPELAVLFAAGLIVCSLPQTPTPWSQLARIRDRTPTPVFEQRAAVQLVRATTTPGDKVVILIPLGHRIAYDADVTNISPYSSSESMPTREQLERLIATMRGEGADQVYIAFRYIGPEQAEALQAAGFVVEQPDPSRRYAMMVDHGAPAGG